MIVIGSDHAGYEMKEKIKKMLSEKNHQYIDVSEKYIENDDYTDVVADICRKMRDIDLAIMVCGTGIGSSIMANKFKGIRAAICYDEYTAKFTRLHNNANMLCLGGRTVLAEDEKKLFSIVNTFIATEFSNEERHIRRLNKIREVEEGN